MTKYKWEYVEHGYITIEGWNMCSKVELKNVGEYTTFIDVKTNHKKHIITNLGVKELKDHLDEDGGRGYSTLWETYYIKKRYCNVRDKFIKKLNKKSVTIIDKDWLLN